MSAAMSSAMSRTSIGRSMSAVRPCPWRSGVMTRWRSARVGRIGPEHLARRQPAVQQYQGPPGPVSLVVEVDAVDLGVVAAALRLGLSVGRHGRPPLFVEGQG